MPLKDRSTEIRPTNREADSDDDDDNEDELDSEDDDATMSTRTAASTRATTTRRTTNIMKGTTDSNNGIDLNNETSPLEGVGWGENMTLLVAEAGAGVRGGHVIRGASLMDEGRYVCRITNDLGSAENFIDIQLLSKVNYPQ